MILFLSAKAAFAASPPRFTLKIDPSAAEAVFAATNSDPAQANALVAAAMKLPATQAMIAKEHKYFPDASEDSFRAAVGAVVSGNDSKAFALHDVRANAAKIRAFLDDLKERHPELTQRLADRLSAFAPPDVKIDATLALVLGSHQNGWVPDQKTPIFYMDVGLVSDVDSMIATAAHEMFHVVQGVAQPDWSSFFIDSTASSPVERQMHNLHAAFMNLVVEGMADYVGDPNVLRGTGTNIARDRKEYARNLARSNETFALFDTIVFRFSRDSGAPLEPLLTIGFGGSWDQTGYYVGYSMAKAIDRYLGRERLRALVALPPEDFLLDYIEVSKAHPKDREITPLAATTVDAVMASKASLLTSNHE